VSTHTSADRHVDLVVIGSGSGNSIVDDAFADHQVAIIEQGVFGGTCLNVGCIPTKMFVYPADVLDAAAHGDALGVRTSARGADWARVRDRIFSRIDPISDGGRSWRRQGKPHVRLYEGEARFVGERTVDTGTGEVLSADQVVVATGSRPTVPDIEGLSEVGFHTSDTVMRIEELPERLLILGGGYVSAEFAHVFSSFGSAVTVVNRTGSLLTPQDEEVSACFTEQAADRWDLRLGRTVSRFVKVAGGIRAELDDGTSVLTDLVLVAIGRTPNSDQLALDAAGVEVGEDGLVRVDEYQRTTAPGVWALGDVSSEWQLKHVANADARVVRHNLLHPESLRASDNRFVPSAVFSHPQVASVGLTEQQARERQQETGRRYVTSKQMYADTAYGWAMEDRTSFAKLVADPETGLLLGGHIIGPQASNLIQPVIQAMHAGQRADDVAEGQYWIHPALTEVVENALLQLALD
jgi:mycothione reductase